jgi:hypothetical protein
MTTPSCSLRLFKGEINVFPGKPCDLGFFCHTYPYLLRPVNLYAGVILKNKFLAFSGSLIPLSIGVFEISGVYGPTMSQRDLWNAKGVNAFRN